MPQTHAPPGQLHVSRAAMADDDHCCSARTPRRPLCSPPVRACRRSVASVQREHQRACSLKQRRSSNKAGREARSRRRAVVKLGWPSLPRSHAHTPANAPCSSPASLSWNTCSQSQRGNVPSRKDPFPTLSALRVHPLALIPSLPLPLGNQRPSCVTLILLPHHQQPSTAGPLLPSSDRSPSSPSALWRCCSLRIFCACDVCDTDAFIHQPLRLNIAVCCSPTPLC